jgi:FkbM family methyltransferase
MKQRSRDLERIRFNGLEFVSPPGNLGGFYSICFGGAYNPILGRLRSTDVVLDGGANIGVFSIRAAQTAHHVYAVEPDPVNFDFLVKNIHLNGTTNVTPIRAILSDQDGTAFLEGDGEVAHLSNRGRKVNTLTVKSALARQSASVIKLDIEGAELLALADLNILRSVRLLCFELDEAGLRQVMRSRDHSGLAVQSYDQLRDQLRELGFSISDYYSAEIRPFWHLRPLDLVRAEVSTNLFGTRFFLGLLLSTGHNAWNLESLKRPDLDMVYAVRD